MFINQSKKNNVFERKKTCAKNKKSLMYKEQTGYDVGGGQEILREIIHLLQHC